MEKIAGRRDHFGWLLGITDTSEIARDRSAISRQQRSKLGEVAA
jgi:hypothetical protein